MAKKKKTKSVRAKKGKRPSGAKVRRKKKTRTKNASKIIGDGSKAKEPVAKDSEAVQLPKPIAPTIEGAPEQMEMPTDAFENDTNINEGGL